MEKRTISVKIDCFTPEFLMIIPVPSSHDPVEYINDILEAILKEDLIYNVEWDFVDGIS